MVSFAESPEYLAAEFSDEEEVSVVNTFVHVGPRRSRKTDFNSRTAPERMLSAAAKAAVQITDAASLGDDELEELEDEHRDPNQDQPICRFKTTDSFETSSTSGPESEDEEPMEKSQNWPQKEHKQVLELSDLIADSSSTAPQEARQMLQQKGMQLAAMPVPVMLVPTVMIQTCPGTATSAPSSSLPETSRLAETKKSSPRKATAAAVVRGPARIEKEIASSGKECIRWIVDGRKLETNCNQLLSREFELEVPEVGLQPFKLMLHAKSSKARGGKGFQKVGGRSLLSLKCESSLPSVAGRLAVQVTVGKGSSAELSSGVVRHNFLDQNCCPLQEEGDDWNLLQMMDRASKYFEICLEVVDQ